MADPLRLTCRPSPGISLITAMIVIILRRQIIVDKVIPAVLLWGVYLKSLGYWSF
jgi:hypothetical protein